MAYWQDREAATRAELTKRTTEQIEKQIGKYYERASRKVIRDFEDVYNRILQASKDGIAPTPADLYKLDKYWTAQAQMRQELEKLGRMEVVKLTKAFERSFFEVYHSIAIEGGRAYSTIDRQGALQLINSIWCADGKSWSDRIWKNTEELAETLNNGLIHIVVSGKNPNQLKHILQEQFEVSFRRADSLVRTELAHIQTQAAQQRYKDYGIEQVQVWADEDERRCDVCGKLHEKKYFVNEAMPIPAHPNCRCTLLPVVE